MQLHNQLLSQKITIALPTELFIQVERLAAYTYSRPGTIIRQAVSEYVRDPQRAVIADPESGQVEKMYEYIKDSHPYLDPQDAVLIRLLYDLKIKEQQKRASE